jgi:hypothetical protein
MGSGTRTNKISLGLDNLSSDRSLGDPLNVALRLWTVWADLQGAEL